MSRALIPGSFDPITVGHLDVIKRASYIFDDIVVLVSKNSEKSYMFTDEQRKDLVESAVKNIKNVTVDLYDGLLAEYVHNNNIDVVVKGLRNSLDYTYEADMALANERISKTMHSESFETIFIPCKPEFSDISSTLVRVLIESESNIDLMVPDSKLLLRMLNK